jgi:hypothetical protein
MARRQVSIRFRGEPLKEAIANPDRDPLQRAWYRGGTLEEIWSSRQIATGVPLIVLLNSAQPECRVGRITRLRRWSSDAIIDCVAEVLWLGKGCRALVYDGRRGYTIFPRGVDPRTGGMIYMDAWPGDSVLCAKKNRAGTRAIRHARGNWLLSYSDFARVLYAALIDVRVLHFLQAEGLLLDESAARRAQSPSSKLRRSRKPRR